MDGEKLTSNMYPAVIDGDKGAYGVVLPDMPGACCAMGSTVDEALRNAEVALSEFAADLEERGEGVPPPSTIEGVDLAEGEMVAFVTLRVPVST